MRWVVKMLKQLWVRLLLFLLIFSVLTALAALLGLL
jgi:hypothetical protein